jgi:SAM-dependent methyltransferase
LSVGPIWHGHAAERQHQQGVAIVIAPEEKRALERRYYPALQETVFGRFEREFVRCLGRDAVVLDTGSGPGSWILQEQRERLRLLVGEDVYLPDVSHLDAFTLADAQHLPFADHSFDVVVSYLVIEHLPDPAAAFCEYARVLKPGGYFVFKTPAVRTPLFLLSRLLPTGLHKRLKARIGTPEEDVFPACYRANTVSVLERELTAAGFRRAWLTTVDQTYAYLSHNRWTYALGLLYSRMTEWRALAWLRNQIIGIYQMPKEMQ